MKISKSQLRNIILEVIGEAAPDPFRLAERSSGSARTRAGRESGLRALALNIAMAVPDIITRASKTSRLSNNIRHPDDTRDSQIHLMSVADALDKSDTFMDDLSDLIYKHIKDVEPRDPFGSGKNIKDVEPIGPFGSGRRLASRNPRSGEK